MGVDYRGNYGIGYEVTETDGIDEELMGIGLVDYVYSELSDNFVKVGEGSYSSEVDGVFIGFKLDKVSKFNEIGGLYVY